MSLSVPPFVRRRAGACALRASAALVVALAAPAATAAAQTVVVEIGDQDFPDGRLPVGGELTLLSRGEPEPFASFRGFDGTGPDFAASWTFDFAPLASVRAATLTLGLYDVDAFLPGSQVASFVLDGAVDLTAALDAAAEAARSPQGSISVFTLALGGPALAALADGSASFALRLQGGGTQAFNGAALDFARLELSSGTPRTASTVPEPSTWALAGTGLLALGGVAARRRRRADGRTR